MKKYMAAPSTATMTRVMMRLPGPDFAAPAVVSVRNMEKFIDFTSEKLFPVKYNL